MKRLVTVSLLIALGASATFGSLYLWNPKKRPPVAIEEALRQAGKLLGEDANNRYCVSASLHGNEEGDGKEGAWNLFYAAADGSKKQVVVGMNRNGYVKLWNGPIDWAKHDGQPTGVDAVKERLEDFLQRNHIEANIRLDAGVLTAQYQVRKFQVYNELDDGEFGVVLVEVVGPTGKGFMLRVEEVSHFVSDYDYQVYNNPFDGGPYWQSHKGTYLTTTPDVFLKVEVRYGSNVRMVFFDGLLGIFGEPHWPSAD